MSLPAEVGLCTIRGRYLSARLEGADQEGVPLTGLTATFTTTLRPPMLKAAGSTPPVTILVAPVTVRSNADGVLVGDDGSTDTTLIASDYPDPENPWTYRVNIVGPGFAPQEFYIVAPTGGVLDLTEVLEAPSGTGFDLSAWSALVVRAEAARTDAETARTAAESARADAESARAGAVVAQQAAEDVPAQVDTAMDAVLADPTSAASTRLLTTFGVASRTVYSAINERVVFAPGASLTFAWVFVPAREPGTHYGMCIIKTGGQYQINALYATGDLGHVTLAEPVFSIAGDGTYDPSLLILPNGDLVMGCHGGNEGQLHFFNSTTQGATWATQAVFDPGVATITHRRFSEVMLMRVPLGNAYTGTLNRIVAAWCDIDPVLPAGRDTVMVTAFSDDEGVTWSTPVVVTPTSGPTSAGLLNDNTRPWIWMDDAGQINMVYSRFDGTTNIASVWHTVLSGDGATVVAAPVKVQDGLYTGSNRADLPGCGPAVFMGRDGLYHLVWTESNYAKSGSDGAMFMMSGDGTPTGWTNKTLLLHRTDAPNGFGRVQPTRIGGAMELLYGFVNTSTTSQLRSLTISGL